MSAAPPLPSPPTEPECLAVLQPANDNEPLSHTEKANAVFFLTLLPACAVTAIVCLLHLGVL